MYSLVMYSNVCSVTAANFAAGIVWLWIRWANTLWHQLFFFGLHDDDEYNVCIDNDDDDDDDGDYRIAMLLQHILWAYSPPSDNPTPVVHPTQLICILYLYLYFWTYKYKDKPTLVDRITPLIVLNIRVPKT